MSAGHPESPTQDTPPAINYLHILEKLVAESDSKSVVFTEEVSNDSKNSELDPRLTIYIIELSEFQPN